MGGYFIVNGNEKVIRMLIMPRRNYPIAMSRPKWKSRGQGYTQYGKVILENTILSEKVPFQEQPAPVMSFDFILCPLLTKQCLTYVLNLLYSALRNDNKK